MTTAPADLNVEIVHGRVVGKDSHAENTTVYRGQQSATIHRTPEIWIRDQSGREHHIRAHAVYDAREGHELVIVKSRKDGRILRIANLDTRTIRDFNDLAPDQDAWAVLRASVWKLFTLYLPVVLVAVFLGSATGLADSFIGKLVGFATNLLFLACFYLGWRATEDRAEQAKACRAKVDDLFRQNGWLTSDAA